MAAKRRAAKRDGEIRMKDPDNPLDAILWAYVTTCGAIEVGARPAADWQPVADVLYALAEVIRRGELADLDVDRTSPARWARRILKKAPAPPPHVVTQAMIVRRLVADAESVTGKLGDVVAQVTARARNVLDLPRDNWRAVNDAIVRKTRERATTRRGAISGELLVKDILIAHGKTEVEARDMVNGAMRSTT